MVDELLKKYRIISDQVSKAELKIILSTLEQVRDVEGDVVEFGCYTGTTSLFLQRLLQLQKSSRTLHVYDSFEGLPPKTARDVSPAGEQFRTGELSASKKQFIETFKRAGLKLPLIHKGWFEDISPNDVPPKIAFAFLDGDYYSSIKSSLELIWPRLTGGAVVVIDDYVSESLPGAAKAVDECLGHHRASKRVEDSLAILGVY